MEPGERGHAAADRKCTCAVHDQDDTPAMIRRDIEKCKASAGTHACICSAPNIVLINNASSKYKLRAHQDACQASEHKCSCRGDFAYLIHTNYHCNAAVHPCICKDAGYASDCNADHHDCICTHGDNEEDPTCLCGLHLCFDAPGSGSESERGEDYEEPASKRVRAK